ncbi:MAG: alpha/beta fold hydrolase [Clostridia bacterium]|nr:alpha/beta fold hydrolase [Clostridia bacterium]
MGFISRQLENIYRSILFRRHDSDGSIFYFSPDDFDGLVSEDFSFRSKRGHLLNGSFYYYGNPDRSKLLIFEHGMGNGHRGYFREIELLAKRGYFVYSYDHTGCERSEGEHIHGLSGSLSDLDDCIRALVAEKGYTEEQISVIGHSWGGFSSLNILKYHPNLSKIVAMSGFISIPAMQSQIVPFLFKQARRDLFDLEKRTNPGFAESNAVEVLGSTDRPVLVIHSMDDRTVSYKTNFNVLSRSLIEKTNIEYMLVSGSGHSPHYTSYAFAYKEDFFKELKRQRKLGCLETSEQKEAFVDIFDWYAMTEQDEDLWEKIFKFLDK